MSTYPTWLACPGCHRNLDLSLHCPVCQRTFTVSDGIPCFNEQRDSTHEALYESPLGREWIASGGDSRLERWPVIGKPLQQLRWHVSLDHARERFISRQLASLKKPARILDLACGAGRRYYTRYGEVSGSDIVLEPLRHARALYPFVFQADASSLPVQDDVFDAVVAADFFGHIPREKKAAILNEIYRVLKPGGITIQIIETDGDNPLLRHARSFNDLYQQYFIDGPGHIGLEPPGVVVKRFCGAGFVPRKVRKIWSVIWPVQMYRSLEGAFADRSPWLKALAGASKSLSRSAWIREAMNLALTPVSFAMDWMTPLAHASGLLMCAMKPRGEVPRL